MTGKRGDAREQGSSEPRRRKTGDGQSPERHFSRSGKQLPVAEGVQRDNIESLIQKGRMTMKVILQQDVKGQGKKGQMIEASDGYARNFLLPRKLAVPATAENINTMKMQEKAKAAQEAAEKAEAQATAAKLKELSVKVTAKAGNGGRLFGAVTTKEIADALSAQHGISIQKTKIVQDEPIKAFGTYELKVKLGYEVTGTLKVVVAEA